MFYAFLKSTNDIQQTIRKIFLDMLDGRLLKLSRQNRRNFSAFRDLILCASNVLCMLLYTCVYVEANNII